MARWTNLVAMFDDIITYVRNHNDTLYWNDSVGSFYRIQVGTTSGIPSWEITPNDVNRSGRAGRGLDLRFAMETLEGRKKLLETLNELKNQPLPPDPKSKPLQPPSPRTAWERLMSDD